jgi:hypothetical protein
LAGGFEFSKGNGQSCPPSVAKNLVKAFDLLNYELGVLQPKEKVLLQNKEAGLPQNWLTAGAKPLSRILEFQGHKVGLLVLPTIDALDKESPQTSFQLVNKQAEYLKSRVNLLIGLSQWGSNLERKYLQSSPPLFDIFLGSGPGPGFAGKYRQQDNTLWVRPYDEGKSVSIIKISKWPKKETKHKWTPYKEIKTGLAKLSDDMPRDPKVASVLAN